MSSPANLPAVQSPLQKSRSLCLALGALILSAMAAFGASGSINSDGRIHLTVNFRFPPTPAQLTTFQSRIADMSHTLYDATEGQLRIGNVSITCGSVSSPLADFWIYAEPLRSNSPVDKLSTNGAHIKFFFAESGDVYAHEFGHLGFGLWDEYEESSTTCNGQGFCIEESPAAFNEQSQCLMQQSPGVSWSELCGASNHDPIRGNNTACLLNPPNAGGAPCAVGCGDWNTTTGKYETSRQQQIGHHSCWESLVAKFPFLTAPAGLPDIAEPAGWIAPTFTNTCTAADTLLLVLDQSGSMSLNVNRDDGEVCGNGVDDDRDGSVDETGDCAGSRMEFVKAAARSLLELASDSSVRAGIVSFNATPVLESGFVPISPSLTALKGTVDLLSPGGSTAIGSALQLGKTTFDADSAPSSSKAAILITDGVNTAGPAPDVAVPDYVSAGIRIFAISTGEASNDATLTSVANNTRGQRVDEPQGSSLVTALAETWSLYTAGGVVVPKLAYGINRSGRDAIRDLRQGAPDPEQVEAWTRANLIPFHVETGTSQLSAVLAGNLGIMSGFGVRAILTAPDGTVIDSDAPTPDARVVYDRYFTLVRIKEPRPGTWALVVLGRDAAAPVQTGHLIVISDSLVTHLFADLDRHIITAPGQPIKATILPSYHTGLRNVVWHARVHRPDGTSVPLDVQPSAKPEYYNATLTSFPQRGLYVVDIAMETRPETIIDPGEPRPGTAPPNSLPVPPIQRTARLFFFVQTGDWVCNQADCDHDGIPGESMTTDRDHDQIPEALDPDDNGNDVPDLHEQPGWPPHGSDGAGKHHVTFGFGVGSTHPLGRLDNVANANIYAKLDLDQALTSAYHARLTFGLAQLTAKTTALIPHPRFLHGSLNLLRLFPRPSGAIPYVEAGPGLYRAESGTTSAGANLGFGVQVPLGVPGALELGVDLHQIDGARTTFFTWHLGVLFH